MRPQSINSNGLECPTDCPSGIENIAEFHGVSNLFTPSGANENPGALVGAAGEDRKEHDPSREGYARQARIARRKPLADWNRSRWAWKRAVKRDSRLSKTAKLVGITLCDDFAHHDTAYCCPFMETLGEATGDPERTLRRALADLEACGWIVRLKGRGRGRASRIVFCADAEAGAVIPENVTEMAAYRQLDDPENAQETRPRVAPISKSRRRSYRPKPAERAASSGRSHIEPKKTKGAGARGGGSPVRPVPWSRPVAPGSEAEREWEAWLAAKRMPGLQAVGRMVPGGWDMPSAWPPRSDDDERTRQAERFVAWLVAQVVPSREAAA